MNFLRRTLDTNPAAPAVAWGWLLLRAVTGTMVCYIHGWHKLAGGLAYLREGTPWKLVEEVAEMHFPAPVPSAFAATAVQLVGGALLAAGFYTRLNAFLLTGTLGVAVLQNLFAHRDPQLAVLYTLVAATFTLVGGGRYSLDASLAATGGRP